MFIALYVFPYYPLLSLVCPSCNYFILSALFSPDSNNEFRYPFNSLKHCQKLDLSLCKISQHKQFCCISNNMILCEENFDCVCLSSLFCQTWSEKKGKYQNKFTLIRCGWCLLLCFCNRQIVTLLQLKLKRAKQELSLNTLLQRSQRNSIELNSLT